MASYYRKFIDMFSAIISILIILTTQKHPKNKLTGWNDDCQLAFDKIKYLLCSAAVLVLPDFDKPFRIETDASGYGVGGGISQFVDNYWRPVIIGVVICLEENKIIQR